MNLTSTNQSLEILTANAVTVDVQVSFSDIDKTAATNLIPGSAQTTISTASSTTVVGAPAANIYRVTTGLSVRNTAGTTQVVTVRKDVGGIKYNIAKATLLAGEALIYEDAAGWDKYSADGKRLSQGADGAPGVDGLQGPAGQEGDAGLDGDRGPPGPQGLTGSQGPQGNIGPQGIQGPIGFQGQDGIDGVDGDVGPIGPRGPQGDTGPQGIQGVAGPAGADGEQGPEGDAGVRGPQGIQGVAGPQGIQGPNGPAGADGVDGIDGDIGPSGQPGTQGPAGTNGLNGAPGPLVFMEADPGEDGWTIPGPQGPAGTGATITEVEVDFGTVPKYDANFVIVDALISATSKVTISESGKPAVGRVAGDSQWDSINIAANPGTGSMTIYCMAHPGPVAGRRKLQYQVV